MRGAKRFSVKVLLLLQLLSLTSSSSDSSSQEKTHGIQREVKKTEGRLERREDPKGRKSLNLGESAIDFFHFPFGDHFVSA